MASTAWQFTNNTTNFTSKVLSASITQGRRSYLDDYPGGRLVFTIDNTNNYATNFAFNNQIRVYAVSLDLGYDDIFTVQEIEFSDPAGDVDFCTATISCVDALGRTGRYQAINKSLTSVGTIAQMRQFESASGGPLPNTFQIRDESGTSGSGSSTASAQTYTGTVLNQLNLLQTTERGVFRTGPLGASTTNTIWALPRTGIDTGLLDFTFGRTTSATQIAYQSFTRRQNGLQFVNDATIQPEGLADQNAQNTDSITTYGYGSYTAATVDVDTTQALGNAQWIANSFSDPAALRYELEFTDKAQTTAAYGLFIVTFFSPTRVVNEISYRLPGAVSDTTLDVASEGWDISITPQQTSYRIYFSPLDYYNFFTLDNAVLGVLDSSRLGW